MKNNISLFIKSLINKFKSKKENINVLKANPILKLLGIITASIGLLNLIINFVLFLLEVISASIINYQFDFLILITILLIQVNIVMIIIYSVSSLKLIKDVNNYNKVILYSAWNCIMSIINFFWIKAVPLTYANNMFDTIKTFNIICFVVGIIQLTSPIIIDVLAKKYIITSKKLSITTKNLLEVYGLKKYFPVEFDFFGNPTKWLHAVEDVSFTLENGKTLGIVGESGCGKTTLGRTILRLYDIQGGKVIFDGNDITDLPTNEMNKYRTRIQYVFQDPYSSLPPRMPVGEIIAEPVKVNHIVPPNEVKAYVLKVMKDCGLQADYYDRYPHEFSGGQRQRICIARALAVKPELIILDEPVSALDVSIQAQIINLLKKLQQKEGYSYVFITHDISVVKYVSDEIGVMYLGSMVEKGDNASIFSEPLHPYTKALFSAVPIADPNIKMNRIILKGDIPSPSNPPTGCKFHTRCNECKEICKHVAPEFRELKKGHFVACHLYDEEK